MAALLVAVLYLPFLAVPFEYDDKVEILGNRILRDPSLEELRRYNPFRLVLLASFAADLWAWGFTAWGYRLVNVAIHLANVLLLAQSLRRLGSRLLPEGGRLFVAAGTLFFAVHPLAIESVTYISGRSTSLATLFALLALEAYGRRRDLDREGGEAWARWSETVSARARHASTAALLFSVATAFFSHIVRDMEPEPSLRLAFGAASVGAVLATAWVARAWRDLPLPADGAGLAPQRARARRLSLLALAAFVLGCMTKEIAATLPAILWLAEALAWGTLRQSWGRLWGRLFPYFALPIYLLALRAITYGYIASPEPIRSVSTNVLTQGEVVVHYLRLWAFPFPQSLYHEYAEVLWPGRLQTWLSLGCLLFLAALLLRARRSAPALCFGGLVLAATLAPTSSVFALKETMVEHRTYLPTVGLAFVVGWFVAGPLRSRTGARAASLVLGLWLLVLCAYNHGYNQLWRNEEALWSHAVRVNPQASDAWRYLGDIYVGQGRLSDAEQAFEASVAARPWNADARNKLGAALARQGQLDRAERAFRQALEAAPCYTPALNNLAMTMRQRGNFQAALDLYDESLQCEAENLMAHIGLGHIYFEAVQEPQKAADHYGKALDLLDPLHPEARRIKARLLELTW